MGKDTDIENELMRSVNVDEKIITKNRVLKVYTSLLLMALVMVIGLSVLMVFVMNQLKNNTVKMNTSEQIVYNMREDVKKINRRTYAINDISRVALYYNPYWDEWTLNQVAQMIYDVGEQKYGIPYEEFCILISLESRWHIKTTSRMYAKGLCQIQWETAKWACGDLGMDFNGDETLYDPFKNVRLGLYIYKTFKAKFEYEYPWYIVAYAGGETRVYPMFLKRTKITGEYLQYHKDWLKIKEEVEKVMGKKIEIQ